MLIGPNTDFIQNELNMWFSDVNRFTRDLYEVTETEGTKTKYLVTVRNLFKQFKEYLMPDVVFRNIDQITDDVKETITGTAFTYQNWNDLLFHKDLTFDVSHFENPKPMFIFKCEEKIGRLGKVLLCFSKEDGQWYLTLRDTEGRIFEKSRANINELNNSMISYRSLSLAAMPKAFFNMVNALTVKDADLETDITDIDERVEALEQDHSQIHTITVEGSKLVIR